MVVGKWSCTDQDQITADDDSSDNVTVRHNSEHHRVKIEDRKMLYIKMYSPATTSRYNTICIVALS